MACCIYKLGFQFSENNPIFIITSLKRKRQIDRGNLISPSQIFNSGGQRSWTSAQKEWVVACLCKCLLFRPFFSILGTLEWEIDCLPHLGLFTTPTSGSLSYACLLFYVPEWWQRNSSYKETNYFCCLNEGVIQLFLLATKERVLWC